MRVGGNGVEAEGAEFSHIDSAHPDSTLAARPLSCLESHAPSPYLPPSIVGLFG